MKLLIFCTLELPLALSFLGEGLLAQGGRADYERARKLQALTANKVYKTSVKPHWQKDNTRFWYRNDLAGGEREFIFVDAEKGKRRPAFDHARLAKALGKATGKQHAAERLPIDGLDFDPTGKQLFFSSQGKQWRLELRDYELSQTKRSEPAVRRLVLSAQPRRSRRTGEETWIDFVNQIQGEIQVIWISTNGERRSYAKLRPGGRHRQHTYAGHVWLVADEKGKTLAVFEAIEGGGEAVVDGRQRRPSRRRSGGARSPDGRWRVFVKDHNLHLQDLRSRQEAPLSRDGSAEDFYTQRITWSPDSKKLVALRSTKGEKREVYIIESAPKDQLQPKLHSYTYAKPGDKIPVPRPVLFDVESCKSIPITGKLFENAWSISKLHWSPDSQWLRFLYNQRGHRVMRIVDVDAASGVARAIVDECPKTFFDYSGKLFVQHLDQSGELIWMSELDGWNHLYLYDTKQGRVKQQITKGEWVVRGVDLVDEKERQIWFRAGGIRQEQDPYYVHYCRVDFDGTGLVILTEGDGTHKVTFSPDRRFIIDTYSRVDLPPITELRAASDGKLLCELERADWHALLATGWRTPERFVAKGRDGKTDIYGVVYRPSNFDPKKAYPVIENIYAGPHSAFVPKSFSAFRSSQAMAELGFIVVHIDGMGTSQRSKAFHDVAWKNLGDGGFADRMLWIQAAAAKYPCMDITKVGIYGGSAGGQNALRAMLDHGDFYKVCVADCGCHDNRMDKIWWNELWMSWPVGPHYAESSNVTHAHKLEGKLLLIVGELDRNVDPASTMQVVNALVKADRDFEMLVLPGRGHGAAETPYGRRRRADFFVRHLLGVEPRSRP